MFNTLEFILQMNGRSILYFLWIVSIFQIIFQIDFCIIAKHFREDLNNLKLQIGRFDIV